VGCSHDCTGVHVHASSDWICIVQCFHQAMMSAHLFWCACNTLLCIYPCCAVLFHHRGELRIYLRDRPLTPILPMDDSDRDYE